MTYKEYKENTGRKQHGEALVSRRRDATNAFILQFYVEHREMPTEEEISAIWDSVF